MIRRSVLAAFALFALSACGQGDAESSGEPTTINFSILSTENSQNLQEMWEPFLADMEKSTGYQIKPFYASNYTSLIEAMRFNQVQVGWFSNQSGLEAVRRADAEVFARSSDPSGVDGYQSVVIVNAKSRLTLEDLLRCDRSLTFGLGDAKSTSGTLAPMTYLFAPRNIDPQTCFKTVRTANHEANLLSVSGGLLDAATNNTTNIKRMERQRPQIVRNIRVVWSSPTIPEDPILWRKDLDPAAKEKIRAFLLNYGTGTGPEAERQRAILTRLDFGVFQPADENHLLPVREMEATEKLLQARISREPAVIAAAERELAAVRAERAAYEARTAQAPADAPPAQK